MPDAAYSQATALQTLKQVNGKRAKRKWFCEQ